MSTNPAPAQIAEIARGLTKAQRVWLLTGKGGASTQCVCDRQGLSEIIMLSPIKGERRLTPLGLALRNHLAQRSEA